MSDGTLCYFEDPHERSEHNDSLVVLMTLQHSGMCMCIPCYIFERQFVDYYLYVI